MKSIILVVVFLAYGSVVFAEMGLVTQHSLPSGMVVEVHAKNLKTLQEASRKIEAWCERKEQSCISESLNGANPRFRVTAPIDMVDGAVLNRLIPHSIIATR